MSLSDEEIDVVSIDATVVCAILPISISVNATQSQVTSCDVAASLMSDISATVVATAKPNVMLNIGKSFS